VRTMIEQHLGNDPATGAPLRRLREITTDPENYPDMSEADVEDLHAALVELERLDLPTRQAVRANMQRLNWDENNPAYIRRAIYLATRERVFH
jgi:hypothetical protein